MTIETLTVIKGENKFELAAKPANWVLARDGGYSPVQMLVTAVGTCGGYVYASVLENSHVPFRFQKVEVAYERAQDRQSQPISAIEIRFFVEISAEYQAKAQRCVKLVTANCPVIQSLDPAIKVTETVTFI